MPKKPINYKKACVYRLIYNDITYYVGSTTNMRQRKSQHRRGCYNEKNKDYNYPLYKFIRENEGFNNWKMIMVHAYPECKTSEELRMHERNHIEELKPSLNVNRPIVTEEEKQNEANDRSRKARLKNPEQLKQWRLENAEHIKKYKLQYCVDNADKIREYAEAHRDEINLKGKMYREANAEKIKERDKKTIVCECGRVINLRHKTSHEKLKIHINLMEAKKK